MFANETYNPSPLVQGRLEIVLRVKVRCGNETAYSKECLNEGKFTDKHASYCILIVRFPYLIIPSYNVYLA